jgi:flagellar biosynthesis protein
MRLHINKMDAPVSPAAETNPQTGTSNVDDTGRRASRSGGQRKSDREIAVALSHEHGTEDLPRVIATGQGLVAQQILEIAFERGIKVREDADLAEVLAAVEVESEIPLAAFSAVAEILSYVYRASGETGSGKTGPEKNQENRP